MPNSPLRASNRSAFWLLAALAFLLALVLAIAMVLTWTIDEAADAYERGFALLGLTLVMTFVGGLLVWFGRRPPPAPRAADAAPTDRFERRLLGPSWTDWLGLAIPPLLIGLPMLGLGLSAEHPRPVEEVVLGALGITGLLELLIAPAVLHARREWVAIELRPEGLVLLTRGGAARFVRRGELRQVRLAVRAARNFQFGVLELDLGVAAPITFREPMTRELPQIAQAIGAHMQAPLYDGWAAARAGGGA